MIQHIDIFIYGKVQGVSFRASTKAVADQLGVKGFAKNLPDGSVHLEAEASPILLDSFLDWCNEGPEKALVEKVEQHGGEIKNYLNFEVLKR